MIDQHCQHCDEGCRVGPDPEYHAATSAVGYIWFAGEGCPVCRALEHLREMADQAEAGAARLISAAGTSMLYGDGIGASSDYLDSDLYRAQASALRDAADRIEAGR